MAGLFKDAPLVGRVVLEDDEALRRAEALLPLARHERRVRGYDVPGSGALLVQVSDDPEESGVLLYRADAGPLLLTCRCVDGQVPVLTGERLYPQTLVPWTGLAGSLGAWTVGDWERVLTPRDLPRRMVPGADSRRVPVQTSVETFGLVLGLGTCAALFLAGVWVIFSSEQLWPGMWLIVAGTVITLLVMITAGRAPRADDGDPFVLPSSPLLDDTAFPDALRRLWALKALRTRVICFGPYVVSATPDITGEMVQGLRRGGAPRRPAALLPPTVARPAEAAPVDGALFRHRSTPHPALLAALDDAQALQARLGALGDLKWAKDAHALLTRQSAEVREMWTDASVQDAALAHLLAGTLSGLCAGLTPQVEAEEQRLLDQRLERLKAEQADLLGQRF